MFWLFTAQGLPTELNTGCPFKPKIENADILENL